MKKLLLILFFVSMIYQNTELHAFKVAIFDFDDRLEEPATTAKYIEKKLKVSLDNLTVDQYTGRKDTSYSIKVLNKMDQDGYDLLITITSDALIIANHVINKTPTLFTNVNNPLSLGFQTIGPPGGMISGASYYISVENQLGFYKKILPDLKRIGFIFDQHNKSKKAELPEVRKTCQNMELGYGIEVVSNVNELEKAALRLIKEGAQAISIASSDLLYNNISIILESCNSALVPIFSFNKKGVKHGALAALASDYNLMADELIIPMAVKVIKEKIDPGTMPIAFLKDHLIFINLPQAEKLNLDISKEIIDQATIVQ